jgi:hypothetical protein
VIPLFARALDCMIQEIHHKKLFESDFVSFGAKIRTYFFDRPHGAMPDPTPPG